MAQNEAEKPNSNGDNGNSTGAGEPEQTKDPVSAPPEGLSSEDNAALQTKAEELVKKMEEGTDRTLEDRLRNIGSQAQRKAAAELELLRMPLGSMLKDEGPSGRLSKDLLELRNTLDKINPHQLSRPGMFGRIVGWIPVIGPVLRRMRIPLALKKIQARYEPVSKQVEKIKDRLEAGIEALIQDNVELEQIYDGVKEHQFVVMKNAYLGELLMNRLNSMLEKADDPEQQRVVESVLHAVSMRTQDLRVMEQANMQFFASIDMTEENNKNLQQNVRRTIDITGNLITVALSIQIALQTQKKVMEATKATQEYAGELLAANAASVREQGAEIREMANNPVIALDKVKSAFDDLMAAIEDAEGAKRKGIENAQKGISMLSDMTSEIGDRISALQAGKEEPAAEESGEDDDPGSVEA